ncbi:hypothetical protein DFH11DRAFT_1323234 [Phellopilus nigrolimitatus]|nr:hypothetical protein DFH11DRAFT_1323234 [Phellopilus nigrolimitatus]
MTTTSGSENGPYFVDTDSQARVRFSSESDALLASFLFGGQKRPQFSLSTFDDLLRILRDPTFKIDEISFTSGVDVLRRIADNRRQIAHERSWPQSALTATVIIPIPLTIVDLVVDTIAAKLPVDANSFSINQEDGYRVTHSARVNFLHKNVETLRNMCLVHRSWTSSVQRAMRRGVHVIGSFGLYALFRNPLVGPWTRHICFEMPNSKFHTKAEDRPDEMFALLAALPHVAPNVTTLAVWAPFNAVAFGPHVIDVIRSLADFQDLTQLTIGSKYGWSRQLPDLCETVARIPSLKRLKLIDWTCPEASSPAIPDFLVKLTPCSELTDIDFKGKADKPAEQYLRWLFRPCKDYALKMLTLHGRNFVSKEHGTQDYSLPLVIRSALPQLETLTLVLYRSSVETKEVYDIFPFCTKLSSLRLRFLYRGNFPLFFRSEYSLLLPSSLEELHITVDIKDIFLKTGGRDVSDDWDTRFVEILNTLPSLRALSVPQIQYLSLWEGSEGVDDEDDGSVRMDDVDNFPLNLPKTENYCAEHGIKLVFYI